MGIGRNYVLDLPMQANEALTKHLFVKLAGDQSVDQGDTLGEEVIGVVQETATAADATSGRVVSVAVMGTAVVVAGAALAVGAHVRSSAAGKAVALAATTADQNVAGILLTAAAADGDLVTILLTPGLQEDT